MVFKNKGDVQSCCNYGGIKLMNHIMKLWEKLLMFGYEERWWSMFRARASCWEITRQMFVFRVLLKYKEGQESYCLCGCIESLWWEGTVAPHEEITSSSEVWGQRDSGDVCSRNAKTMVWVRWETRDARKTQMLGFVWLSDSASFTVIQSVLTITLLNDIMWTEEKTYILYAALVMAATSQIFVWPCAAGPVSGPTHAVGHGLSVELHRWDPGGLWWANKLCCVLFLIHDFRSVSKFGLHLLLSLLPLDPWFWMLCANDMRWLRNQVVAPLTEELVFRACMLPMLVPCAGPSTAIITCPLFFGVGECKFFPA